MTKWGNEGFWLVSYELTFAVLPVSLGAFPVWSKSSFAILTIITCCIVSTLDTNTAAEHFRLALPLWSRLNLRFLISVIFLCIKLASFSMKITIALLIITHRIWFIMTHYLRRHSLGWSLVPLCQGRSLKNDIHRLHVSPSVPCLHLHFGTPCSTIQLEIDYGWAQGRH